MAVLGAEGKRNTSDDINKTVGDTANSAVKMGKQTAKIAAKAASGNYAGAAAEAAKDPETTLKIALMPLLIAAICIFLVVAILFSLPVAIYDNICGYFADVNNYWLELKYGHDDTPAVLKFVDWAWHSLTTPIAGLIESVGDFIDPDTANRELEMMGHEETEQVALLKRAYIVNEKLRVRANQIKTGLTDYNLVNDISKYLKLKYFGISREDQMPDWAIWHTPKVNVVFEDPIETLASGASSTERKTHLNELTNDLKTYPHNGTKEEKNAWEEDFHKKVYDEETDEGYFPPVAESKAIQILSLLSVQKGNSVEDLSNVDLLKSMGWVRAGMFAPDIEFPVGGVDTLLCKVKQWRGTFVPQYLEEEIKTITQLRDRYQRIGQTDKEAECQQAIDNYRNNQGIPLTDLLLKLEYPLLTLNRNGVVVDPEKTTTSTDRNGTHHSYMHYKNPNGYGQLVLHQWINRRSSFINYQFEITPYIGCREIPEVASQVGFYDGAFPRDVTVPTPSPSTGP